ncbi:MAG: ABC transporter permease [Proteobacteria bacterium]|nr:ABC transporter permease [Pseudomonadota bacterium]
MISALDRKLLRDLWRLKGQVLSIALVIASGIALLVMSLSTHEALRETARTYYERYRFGHVFATVERAPLHLEARLGAIDGVQNVQTRISKQAVLDVEGFAEPLLGRLVSIPEGEQPVLNQLVLRSGRLVEPDRPDEVILNESFAEAHGLRPGDSIAAIVNAKRRTLQIVGTATSPEFIYIISPYALIPDKKRYGVLWMGQRALEAAYDYEGAFNDVSLSLQRGADSRQVVEQLDNLLAPYGGVGAVDRDDHLSAWFVNNELEQNRTTARLLPTIFLAVAAYLRSMVLNRLIATERSEIGLLKAFGYSSIQVGWHYAKLVIAMNVIGILLGWGLGAQLGRFSTASYAENLNFPLLIYSPGPVSFAIGALVSLAIGLAATARGVRRAALLPPTVAMSPPAPPSFRPRSGAFAGLTRALDQPTRIILRQIDRWPARAATTALGFALAVAMMILSLSFTDAVDRLAHDHFVESEREDLALAFESPKPITVLHEITRLPAVLSAEPMRIVPANLSSGHVTHRGAVEALTPDARLTRIFDPERGALEVPQSGIAITAKLAEKLGVQTGDEIWLEMLEGRRPEGSILVSAVFDSYIGMSAYTSLETLNDFLGDRPLVENVKVLFDESRETELLAALKGLPTVSAAGLRSAAISNFEATIAETLLIFIGFFSAFSFGLGFGVTYNAQRISLSERGRELATLRVLGFTRRETLYILTGEILLLVLVSLPVGCLLGFGLTALFVNAPGFNTELMRIPLAIQGSTYGASVLVLLIAGLVAGASMKRRIDRLDLVSVLKTRE